MRIALSFIILSAATTLLHGSGQTPSYVYEARSVLPFETNVHERIASCLQNSSTAVWIKDESDHIASEDRIVEHFRWIVERRLGVSSGEILGVAEWALIRAQRECYLTLLAFFKAEPEHPSESTLETTERVTRVGKSMQTLLSAIEHEFEHCDDCTTVYFDLFQHAPCNTPKHLTRFLENFTSMDGMSYQRKKSPYVTQKVKSKAV